MSVPVWPSLSPTAVPLSPLLRRSAASLRGHSGDVVGVAWAPDSQVLEMGP